MCTIAQTLLHALQDEGVSEIFGVPGDYTLGFNVAISDEARQDISFVNMCGEESAGFAADAYARLKGMGCCLATFNAGSLKLLNAAASCAAERVAVVFLVGVPGVKERDDGIWKHHGWGKESYEVPRITFATLTCASAVLDNQFTAAADITRVLKAAKAQQRPVYIELPRDMVNKVVLQKPQDRHQLTSLPAPPPHQLQHTFESWERRMRQVQVDSAVTALIPLLNTCKSIALVAGVEVQRYKLQEIVLQLAKEIDCNQQALQIQAQADVDYKDSSEAGEQICSVVLATTVLGKSAFVEEGNGGVKCVGTFLGKVGNPHARAAVEGADVVLLLGVLPSDTNFRLLGSNLLDKDEEIHTEGARDRTVVRLYDNELHLTSCRQKLTLQDVPLHAVLTGLEKGMHKVRELGFFTFSDTEVQPAQAKSHTYEPLPEPAVAATVVAPLPPVPPLAQYSGVPIRVDAMFDVVRVLLRNMSPQASLLLIADTGDAIFGSLGLPILPGMQDSFLAPVFYLTMGWAIPAAVGAHYAAPQRRPLVFEGDGSFQMTGQEIRCVSHVTID